MANQQKAKQLSPRCYKIDNFTGEGIKSKVNLLASYLVLKENDVYIRVGSYDRFDKIDDITDKEEIQKFASQFSQLNAKKKITWENAKIFEVSEEDKSKISKQNAIETLKLYGFYHNINDAIKDYLIDLKRQQQNKAKK